MIFLYRFFGIGGKLNMRLISSVPNAKEEEETSNGFKMVLVGKYKYIIDMYKCKKGPKEKDHVLGIVMNTNDKNSQ